MSYKLLAINPGSTSTKIALYEGEKCLFKYSVSHDAGKVASFERIIDQYDFRKNAIMTTLDEHDIDLNDLSAVVGRGGMLKPIESGTYRVSDGMVDYVANARRGEHASNLGCVLAKEIGDSLGIPSFIVDPVAVDEMDDIARYTGMPEIKRASLFHALNQKAVALKAAKDLGKPYKELNLIVAHLGGGISVGVHKKGRVVDVNNALDGDGPMSPERSGSVPLGPLYKMCFSGKYTLNEIKRKNYGQGGLVAHLGTNDGREIAKRIEDGDADARAVFEAMCYQIAKEIGSCATVLKGDVDAIVLTGGTAHDKHAVSSIIERVSFIGKVLVHPGEDEMEALALGALRVLEGVEDAKEYH